MSILSLLLLKVDIVNSHHNNGFFWSCHSMFPIYPCIHAHSLRVVNTLLSLQRQLTFPNCNLDIAPQNPLDLMWRSDLSLLDLIWQSSHIPNWAMEVSWSEFSQTLLCLWIFWILFSLALVDLLFVGWTSFQVGMWS
jgi:hypothetical protein